MTGGHTLCLRLSPNEIAPGRILWRALTRAYCRLPSVCDVEVTPEHTTASSSQEFAHVLLGLLSLPSLRELTLHSPPDDGSTSAPSWWTHVVRLVGHGDSAPLTVLRCRVPIPPSAVMWILTGRRRLRALELWLALRDTCRMLALGPPFRLPHVRTLHVRSPWILDPVFVTLLGAVHHTVRHLSLRVDTPVTAEDRTLWETMFTRLAVLPALRHVSLDLRRVGNPPVDLPVGGVPLTLPWHLLDGTSWDTLTVDIRGWLLGGSRAIREYIFDHLPSLRCLAVWYTSTLAGCHRSVERIQGEAGVIRLQTVPSDVVLGDFAWMRHVVKNADPDLDGPSDDGGGAAG